MYVKKCEGGGKRTTSAIGVDSSPVQIVSSQLFFNSLELQPGSRTLSTFDGVFIRIFIRRFDDIRCPPDFFLQPSSGVANGAWIVRNVPKSSLMSTCS